jgi:hypothetical protein
VSIDLPVGGTTRELLYLLHEMSLGENLVHLWMSVGGAVGVASSLEASCLGLGLQCHWWEKVV